MTDSTQNHIHTQKFCNKCSVLKAPHDFHKDKDKKDGLCTICKTCKSSNARVWRSHNSDKDRKTSLSWYYENKHKPHVALARKLNSKKWRENNPHLHSAKEAKRRACKLNATPSWLMPEHLAQINRLYRLRDVISEATNTQYHVDHIVPLQGKSVCGLHVPWNLRVIPAKDNLEKGNRL